MLSSLVLLWAREEDSWAFTTASRLHQEKHSGMNCTVLLLNWRQQLAIPGWLEIDVSLRSYAIPEADALVADHAVSRGGVRQGKATTFA
jgi:hypothetical protein